LGLKETLFISVNSKFNENENCLLLMFLSSVQEHIFLPKTNQNAGCWPSICDNFPGCYPGPLWWDRDTPYRTCPCYL